MKQKSKFIVLEGLDGTGKSTQLKMLKSYFDSKSILSHFIHFPRTEEDSEIFGDMISKFLRGDYGDIDKVHPELVALIYAGDRFNASAELKQKLDEDCYVIADRYVLSNIGYQCAKIKNVYQREQLMDWIFNMEYNYFKIPKPDLSVFLHVPISFVENKLKLNRIGEDRNYLKGKEDIHEKDIDFQKDVENVYLGVCKYMPNDLTYLNCISSDNAMMSAEEIHLNLLELLKKEKLIF